MNKRPNVKVKYLHPLAKEHGLKYATDGSNAFDVRTMEDITVSTDNALVVPLGFAMAIEEGYGAFLLPRSGAGFKYGLEFNNTIGLIDQDFRGEVKACVRLKPVTMNIRDIDMDVWHDCELKFKAGDRIGQVAILPIPQADIEEVDELPTTVRGEGGLGHTGTK